MIQKIIGASPAVDPLLAAVLCPAERGTGRCSKTTTAVRSGKRKHVGESRNNHETRNIFSGHNKQLPKSQVTKLPPCSPVYHYPSSCIGILLASYMLRHCLSSAREQHGDGGGGEVDLFILQDAAALLSWIDQLLLKCKDVSVAYALDILSVVATNLQQA